MLLEQHTQSWEDQLGLSSGVGQIGRETTSIGWFSAWRSNFRLLRVESLLNGPRCRGKTYIAGTVLATICRDGEPDAGASGTIGAQHETREFFSGGPQRESHRLEPLYAGAW
ncbi:hypothetical protein ACH79_40680 [Bradyrhizobium sp. CCBAU 051011]|nr:hypothetical protein ACH79_40680 [Bradyrhizobium sp. CCBAU 051011]